MMLLVKVWVKWSMHRRMEKSDNFLKKPQKVKKLLKNGKVTEAFIKNSNIFRLKEILGYWVKEIKG